MQTVRVFAPSNSCLYSVAVNKNFAGEAIDLHIGLGHCVSSIPTKLLEEDSDPFSCFFSEDRPVCSPNHRFHPVVLVFRGHNISNAEAKWNCKREWECLFCHDRNQQIRRNFIRLKFVWEVQSFTSNAWTKAEELRAKMNHTARDIPLPLDLGKLVTTYLFPTHLLRRVLKPGGSATLCMYEPFVVMLTDGLCGMFTADDEARPFGISPFEI